MSQADDFRLLLMDFDVEVFWKRAGEVCVTTTPMKELVSVTGDLVYVLDRSTVLQQYPKIVTDQRMPKRNFFLIQRREFERRVYEHSWQLPKRQNWIFFLDQATGAMISKSIGLQIACWSGVERYVMEGGLLSAENIVEISGTNTFSVNRVSTFLQKRCKFYLSEHTKLPPSTKVLRKSTSLCAIKVTAQISALFLCIRDTYRWQGAKPALDALRRLADLST